ncbi:MAG: hypothetical protein M1834_005135 [Cirrosporium novae-zelandiae]|nr:MAG: hypothetical protein M1834_005135 [Cirrosporium novae-zelandiae]
MIDLFDHLLFNPLITTIPTLLPHPLSSSIFHTFIVFTMYGLRQFGLRVLAARPAYGRYVPVPKRAFATINSSLVTLRNTQRPGAFLLQRRWASDDAQDDTILQEDPAPSTKPFSGARSPAPPNETVYVGNISFDATEADLKELFSDIGEVTQSHILRDYRGLSRGFGYVSFETTEQAAEAIKRFHDTNFLGRTIITNFAIKKAPSEVGTGPRSAPTNSIFIGNLAWTMTDQDLNNLFKEIGNVTDVRVSVDRATGKPRGFAHADFVDQESATKALEKLNGMELYGRKLRVDYSTPRPPKFNRSGSSDFGSDN